eukprot:gene661-176_t
MADDSQVRVPANLATKDTTELERKMIKDDGAVAEGGIPQALFIENVDTFVEGIDPAELLQALHNLYQKFRSMKQTLSIQRMSLKTKIPDIKQALEMVKKLDKKRQAEESMDTRFMLADNVYVRANVEPKEHVALWLGAGVMMEYTFPEALELLNKNLEVAQESLEKSTTTEVNIARVHNYNVKVRREQREIEAARMKADSNIAIEA